MKNIVCTLIFTSILLNYAGAQNKVLNPSFETGTDPNWLSMLSLCDFWYNPVSSTPDYYKGNDPYAGVPNNNFGFNIPAQHGNAYAGIITFSTRTSPCSPSQYIYREYVMGELNDTLIQGQMYDVSFWVRNSNNNFDNTINQYHTPIGVAFSDTMVNVVTPGLCNVPNLLIPTVFHTNNAVIADSAWIELTFSFTAYGNEKYIVIGNFLSNTCDVVPPAPFDSINTRAYYFIDNVSVRDKKSSSMIENNQNAFNVFPNPAQDLIVFENLNKHISTTMLIEITDIQGQLISKEIMTGNRHYIQCGDWSHGFYSYKITGDNKFIQSGRIVH